MVKCSSVKVNLIKNKYNKDELKYWIIICKVRVSRFKAL